MVPTSVVTCRVKCNCRALLFDSARNVLWLALCAIAVLVLCASGVKHLLKGEGIAALHI